jgi:hypothetical protein
MTSIFLQAQICMDFYTPAVLKIAEALESAAVKSGCEISK